jgi:hypothetical protein
MSREDIVRLGQSNRPWDFLPIAWQVLRIAPDDQGLRLLAAANYGQLGLVTAAREELAKLRPTTAADPAVSGVAEALNSLPADLIPASEIEARVRRNISAARTARPELEAALPRWLEAIAAIQWFRTLDGNIARRQSGAWIAWADHAAAAKRFADQHLGALAPDTAQYILEGLSPPWIALEIDRRTPRAKDGFQPRLIILQADPAEFLDGLAYADLTALLSGERTSLFVGPDASTRFSQSLRKSLDHKLLGPYIPIVGTKARCQPPVSEVLHQTAASQTAEHDHLAAEVAALYAPRDKSFWRKRFEDATAPKTRDPLRILVPTCRYSTYIQHSSRDLVAALRAAGHTAELLIEPDGHTRLSTVAQLRALAAFQPDLVILINYMRANLGPHIPKNLPWVCWIQDAMPHQFNAAVGQEQTELDFLVGHIHAELFSRFDFPRARALDIPVVTSEAKFHDGPVAPGLRTRLDCELAFISHHSETPERMHLRLLAEAGDRALTPVLERLYPRGQEIARDGMGPHQSQRLEHAVRAELNAAGECTPKFVTHLTRHYAIPLAERVFRHEALAWAAEICDRRGWRLKLFGRGWESHPHLAAYAAGELGHGDELRSAYQSAAANLHISITALVHQRVMECALSGGLPLCRLNSTAVEMILSAARRDCWLARSPDAVDPLRTCGDTHGFRIAGDPGLEALAANLAPLGIELGEYLWSRPADLGSLAKSGPTAPERRPDWVIGDLSGLTFRSAAELERRLETAISNPHWRRDRAEAIATRTRERLTLGSFTARVLGLVRDSLS